MVELTPGRSLLDHAVLQIEPEELLGRKVDIVTERGLKTRGGDPVLRYFDVDVEEVWITVERDLPVLKSTVPQILGQLAGEPENDVRHQENVES